MPIVQRYTTTTNGAMTFTGNTLGFGSNNPSYNDIGAFITLDVTQQVPGYPVGSTLNWKLNASQAFLKLPTASEVLYAELIWGGTSKFNSVDVTGEINSSITLIDPQGLIQKISPDATTNQVVVHEKHTFYIRTADVTNLVKASGAGSYTVSGVPATIQRPSKSNAAGWTLAVVYKNSSLPSRNMNLYVGMASVERGSVVDQTITGFGTPESKPFQARALLTAIEGDSFISKDQFLFGPSLGQLQAISGPNNLVDNFFASQINDDVGNLDTSGTAGNSNVSPGQKQSTQRYGWDITNVDISNAMEISQIEATARFKTDMDGFILFGLGIQIDVNSPEIKMDKQVDKDIALVGDELTYTIFVENSGLVEAQNAIFKDILPDELEFVPNSLTIDGQVKPGEDLAKGINIGSVSIEGPVEIIFKVKVIAVPPDGKVVNTGTLDYEFQSAAGLPLTSGSSSSNEANTIIKHVQVDLVKSEDRSVYDKKEDIITYTLDITNNGDTTVSALSIKDVVPTGTVLVPGSLKVNGVPVFGDLSTGVPLGILDPNQTAVITFQVALQSPLPVKVDNQAEATYQFQFKPGSDVREETVTSNLITAWLETDCQKAQNQIFESVAQQELGLMKILQAESVKVQEAVKAFEEERISAQELARINQSVEKVVGKVARLEQVLKEKVEIAKQICC
ncbi:DUF11 domain-containing protein [Bacillus gaemokensis]|uniref:Reticulocyte-binding protein n=1 Tax=Bacillus gaemokensis TaxID=574375 RepID=A0A073K933_9BACI|nr:DUF11 domain-containing protein [Bacillus gaemokensis]KEK23075.1 reticulocyte-binding protein [Bacillus gaemokensis]KYG37585.1 hypothetical protein AZF08_23510 [Bacillus gaemokensis]